MEGRTQASRSINEPAYLPGMSIDMLTAARESTHVVMFRPLNRNITVFYSKHDSLAPMHCISVLPCMGLVSCNGTYYMVGNPQCDKYSMMFTIVGQIKDAVRRMIGRRNSAGDGWQVPNVIQLAITPGGLFMGQNISMLHFPETNGLRCVQFMLHHVHDLIEEDIIRIQRKVRRGRMVRILNRGVWIQRVRNLKALRAKMSMLPFEVQHVIIENVMTTPPDDGSVRGDGCCPVDRIQVEDLQELRASTPTGARSGASASTGGRAAPRARCSSAAA